MTTAATPAFSAGDRDLIVRLATRTLGLLEREYPNSIRLDLHEPITVPISPRRLHPCFYGCYDWHSAVHSVWQVVRAMRVTVDTAFQPAAALVVDRLLTDDNVATELSWVQGRPAFEMPYGMAWLLRLCAELRAWDDERAQRWADTLVPLERHAIDGFDRWAGRLTAPVRGGMHNQTAFSLGLVWDSRGDDAARGIMADVAAGLFGADRAIDLRHEPSAADFLSPALAEADLMRRVMPSAEFGSWIDAFFSDDVSLPAPVTVVDPSDGQLAHWAGLNLSRSWMMGSIAQVLPDDHRLNGALITGAEAHRRAGLQMADHDDYMISHWVPTFAVYLLSDAQRSPSS